MKIHTKDLQYLKIVDNILTNESFNKLKDIEHHGLTRYEHSLRVSYYSYRIAKTLKLSTTETARGALLHDFFINEAKDSKEKMKSVFTHPKKAVNTAKDNFDLTKKEEDMIRAHMFPINLTIPKYLESWIVSTVDKWVALYEFSLSFKFRFKYAYHYMYSIMLFVALGFIK